MLNDPFGDYSNLESEMVYNYGRISGVATETAEIMHHKQTLSMRYKLSYMTFRMRKAWPVFDGLAAYFYLVLNVSILAFALYYQLALFWAVALTIYMISQFINSTNNFKYRQKGRQKFLDKLNEEDDANAMTRLLETEKQKLDNRKTVFFAK